VKEESKPDVAVAFQKILNTSEAVKFEARLLDNFGKEMIFDIVARSVKGENGVEGMLAIGRDFTKRRKDELKLKELNNKLIEANRLVSIERDRAKEQITVLEEIDKLKNDFISNVSHELRTPLASIVGFAEAISSDPEMPRDMINEFNEIIFTEGRRLAKLINDILDFSKLDIEGKALEKSDFNLLDLLRDLVKNNLEAAESKGVIFTSEIPEAMVPIYADKERISNALGHILSNAVKFTDKDGRVTLLVNDFLKDVEIIISDTGVGIPKEDIPKLFEKFSKVNRPGAQAPGAGLGLAAAKKIIDLHNGLIRVKSEINKGTTFIVRLPKKV
jgi:two-component system phosphate regulon sensor histidine kinase PhoR